MQRQRKHQLSPEGAAASGQLLARPTPITAAAPTGLQPLHLDGRWDGLLYIPPGYQPEQPAPLAVLLHGAGGAAAHGLGLLRDQADTHGIILFAPDSHQSTWDVIVHQYGPDVAFIDQALTNLFQHYAIDPNRLAVGGFSDGASYALSLGIINGDLFTHVLAFSPGFIAPTMQQGKPCFFISHGLHDEVLPINFCSRRIVPQLRQAGYEVQYREFDGPHTIPPNIVHDAIAWWL